MIMVNPLIIWGIVSVLILLIPGYIWSYIFFPYTKKDEDPVRPLLQVPFLERLIIAVGISIGLLILGFSLINTLISVPINPLTISLFISAVSIAGVIVIYFYSNHVYIRWKKQILRLFKFGNQ